MLITLRVILLALFIAAPVGKQDIQADPEGLAAEHACSVAPVPDDLAGITAGDEV